MLDQDNTAFEYLGLIFASMSEKGQMLSARLIFCIQNSCPLCLPVHSQISHSLALSLCDVLSIEPVFSICQLTRFSAPASRGPHLGASCPEGTWRYQFPFSLLSQGQMPPGVISFLFQSPTSLAWARGQSLPIPGHTWVKIHPRLALQGPPEVGGCQRRSLGPGLGQERGCRCWRQLVTGQRGKCHGKQRGEDCSEKQPLLAKVMEIHGVQIVWFFRMGQP